MMDPKFFNMLMAKDLTDRDKGQKEQQQDLLSSYSQNKNAQQMSSDDFNDMWDWTKKKW